MTAHETPDELRARLVKGRRLYDAWQAAKPSISALSTLAATEWHDWLKVNISDLLDGVAAIDGMLARLAAAEADADRLAEQMRDTVEEFYGEDGCTYNPNEAECLRLHDEALALRDPS